MVSSNDAFLGNYVRDLKAKIDELAHGAMERPAKDPFEHGVFVGTYRGLQEALMLLDAILEEQDQKERSI